MHAVLFYEFLSSIVIGDALLRAAVYCWVQVHRLRRAGSTWVAWLRDIDLMKVEVNCSMRDPAVRLLTTSLHSLDFQERSG